MHSPIEDIPDPGLKAGVRLYCGDFNPGRNALIIRAGRVREVHKACLVLDTGEGCLETIPLDKVADFGWMRTEYQALERLMWRLLSKTARLEAGIRQTQEMMDAYKARGPL